MTDHCDRAAIRMYQANVTRLPGGKRVTPHINPAFGTLMDGASCTHWGSIASARNGAAGQKNLGPLATTSPALDASLERRTQAGIIFLNNGPVRTADQNDDDNAPDPTNALTFFTVAWIHGRNDRIAPYLRSDASGVSKAVSAPIAFQTQRAISLSNRGVQINAPLA